MVASALSGQSTKDGICEVVGDGAGGFFITTMRVVIAAG
jgi:hypothetical protein